MGFLMSSHPLTNFEIQKYKNEPRFNGVFSRNNLPKKKNKGNLINLPLLSGKNTNCQERHFLVVLIL